MEIRELHRWDVDADAARDLQRSLAEQVDLVSTTARIETACGVDVAYDDATGEAVAAAVVIEVDSGEIHDRQVARSATRFPYVPGLLSFRELPPVVEALAAVSVPPDVIVCDGHGYAHPERFGLACHLGLLTSVPTVGCAKSLYIGSYDEPGTSRGSRSPLVDKGERIGDVLRTQDGVKPLYVSPGHLIDFDRACQVVLDLAYRFRQPETTRQADQLVRAELKAGR